MDTIEEISVGGSTIGSLTIQRFHYIGSSTSNSKDIKPARPGSRNKQHSNTSVSSFQFSNVFTSNEFLFFHPDFGSQKIRINAL